MRRIVMLFAVGVLSASPVLADDLTADPTMKNRMIEKEPGGPTIMKRLRGETDQPSAEAQSAQQPEASEAKPKKAAQSKPRRRKKTAARKREPEPSKTKAAEAEARWWEETGNPVVFTFSGCLAAYAASETRKGSKLSYPEFVTAAMNGDCRTQFEAMAQVLLDRHGEEGFRKIAKELIATTFIPAVKEAAEQAQAKLAEEQKQQEAQQSQPDTARLQSELRNAKEAMLGCFAGESDRLASTSNLSADRLVEPVIESCRSKAEVFFAKLGTLYPDAAAGLKGKTDAVLHDSYSPAIMTRINSKRAAMIASGQ